MIEQKTGPQTALYLRVSTDGQDNANQETGCIHWANTNGHVITETIADQCSSKTPWQQRGIGELIANLGPQSTIITSEVSRLARSTLEVLEIAAAAAEREIVIVATKNNLIFNDTMASKITTTILALAAEIERDFIRTRTKEALTRAKQNGVVLGRPVGSRSASKLDGRESEIARYLSKKLPKSSIAKLLECSRGTLETKLIKMRASNADMMTTPLDFGATERV